MLLKKAQGGCSIGPYTWEHDGDTVDVDYDTALALLAIPGGDFEAANVTPEAQAEQDAPAEGNESAPETPAPEPDAPAEPLAPGPQPASVPEPAPVPGPTPSPLHIAEPVPPLT